jgi:hypothetical protein
MLYFAGYFFPILDEDLLSKEMTKPPDTDRLSNRIHELKKALDQQDPFQLAYHTGSTYSEVGQDEGLFRLRLWEEELLIAYPEFTSRVSQSGVEIAPIHQALLLYYFNTADGTPLDNRWISFSELPNGRFYNQAFQGYTGVELSHHFQNDQPRFERAGHALGGMRVSHGDVSFSFQVLPRVPLMVAYWRGDEDFPASFQLLFDSSASHYLPTDAFAILGSSITHKLINQ